MVAHRLGTIARADRILVFDHGRLVEQGKYEVLLAKQGAYARLWQGGEDAQAWWLPRNVLKENGHGNGC